MLVASEMAVRAINIAVLSFCSLELIILLPSFSHSRLRNRATAIFYTKMLVSAFMLLCYAISFLYDAGSMNHINILMRSMAYVGIFTVYVLYIMYIREQVNSIKNIKKIPEWVIYVAVIVAVIGALLWVFSLFSGPQYMDISQDLRNNGIVAASNIGALLMIILSFVLLLMYRDVLGDRETLMLMSMPILLLIATIAEPFAHGIELRFPAIVLEFLIVYSQHHIELETKQEIEETESLKHRLSSTADRMKPHYMYNVLTTIYYLCETDPQRAQHAIGTFSEYMRSILEIVDNQELVDFEWELREIQNYLALEKIRFGDKLNVVYDIEYEDFQVPPLSIQPLVENAVLHGIGSKAEGGTVSVISRKLSDGGAQIRVKDDGAGFDIESLANQDGSREGIANIRERLSLEVNGDLTITSLEGRGTTAIVTIRSVND